MRERLSYANVMSTLAVFLVLAGGVAYAARVPKKSVGPGQLKSNAVTTAKIKANAVTTRKIKRNAVSNAKLKDGAIESLKIAQGSVNAEDINLDSLPFGRVVQRARGAAVLPLSADGSAQVYPLGGAFYTQGASEVDSFVAAVDVRFSASCEPPRYVDARLAVDPTDPGEPSDEEVVASRTFVDATGGGLLSTRVELSPTGTRFEPGAPRARQLTLALRGGCTGGTGDIDALAAGADVIGTR